LIFSRCLRFLPAFAVLTKKQFAYVCVASGRKT